MSKIKKATVFTNADLDSVETNIKIRLVRNKSTMSELSIEMKKNSAYLANVFYKKSNISFELAKLIVNTLNCERKDIFPDDIYLKYYSI